jgi:hypothetical protein
LSTSSNKNNLRLIAHAAKAHADEIAPRRTRDRLAKGGLADARRAHEAEDRAFHLTHALLHGQVFENAFLDLLKTVMVRIEHGLGVVDVLAHLGALLPRNRQDPVEIVAHDRRFRGHRAHAPQLLQLGDAFLARFLGELGFLDPLFQLRQLVASILALAQLLLDRLQLFVQVVLALGLLHLALDAIADALFHLQNADLSFHEGIDLLKALTYRAALEKLLLFGDLEGEVRGDGVGELASVVDLIYRNQHLRGNLLVELYVLFELRDGGARQGIEFAVISLGIRHDLGIGLEEVLGLFVPGDAGPLPAFDQNLDGAVRQLAAGVGSSCAAFFWVTRRICLSSFITSSKARTDLSRPTNRGTIMCGKTTMSLNGRTGKRVPRGSSKIDPLLSDQKRRKRRASVHSQKPTPR